MDNPEICKYCEDEFEAHKYPCAFDDRFCSVDCESEYERMRRDEYYENYEKASKRPNPDEPYDPPSRYIDINQGKIY